MCIVGLLSKQNLERAKYINVKDFINLVSHTKDESISDIISYFVINDLESNLTSYNIDVHGRIFDSGHTEKFGFDLNTRVFLDEGWAHFLFDKYITYKSSHGMKCDFYYLKDELNSIKFIQELNLDFRLCHQVNKAVNAWSNENEQDLIYREKKVSFDKPNTHQLKLFKLDVFSIIEASCMLAGVRPSSVMKYQNHPEFTQVYDDYISYKLMIELAIENDELYCLNGTIATVILQKYLFNAGYIIKGFNDWLTIEPAKPLIGNKPNEQLEARNNELKEAQAKINKLENQLAQAKAELADKPADSITQSNTDIHNIKKESIKQFNRSIATVLIDLDYKGKLRKSDIANYIVPYMKELAFVLADEQQDKANNLTVTYDTLYDNHLKNLGFKQGRQSDDEKQKVNVDLLFKKQLPITE